MAAGRSGDVANVNAAIARYHPDGTLATTFNGDGWTVTDINRVNNDVRSIAIQPDGKIVAAGSFAPSTINVGFAVIRYNTDGSLDPRSTATASSRRRSRR